MFCFCLIQTTAKRTRRSNNQHRHRNDLSYVMRHPTMANVTFYTKYFFFKSAFGRLVLVFMFVSIFHIFLFSQIIWPKILAWLQNSTTDEVSESSFENEF